MDGDDKRRSVLMTLFGEHSLPITETFCGLSDFNRLRGTKKDAVRDGLKGSRVKEQNISRQGGSPENRASSSRESGGVLPTVLIVVEDNPDDFALLKRALWKASANTRVLWAHDGAEALQLLSQLRAQLSPVCVVADVQLPDFDGFELLHKIRQDAPAMRVPFAFLTGRCDRKMEARAYERGADAFFVKGASTQELLQIARALQVLAASASH